MKAHLGDVNHDYIRYANCWEDADILLSALKVTTSDRVISIGSAGDNAFSLLSCSPEIVVAVDINSAQLQVIALKKAAFRGLGYDEFVEFLGFRPSERRLEYFQRIKQYLSAEALEFWENRSAEIEQGIIYQGKFEKYFGVFRTKILPLIHSKRTVRQLFEPKTAVKQDEFYTSVWNSMRWRLLFSLFFSRFVLGRLGRDPEFLKEVDGSVSQFIFANAERHLRSVACLGNYYLHFILTGTYGTFLPHYARPENFDIIKSRLDNLVIYHGLIDDALEKYGSFSVFNLSDIFEYMSPAIFASVTERLVRSSMMNARYAYWNLMVDRRMSRIHSDLQHSPDSILLHAQDKCFFYNAFILDTYDGR
ncbi:MAG: DUF3419 family protein [Candidatus Kapaibacterium sp.]